MHGRALLADHVDLGNTVEAYLVWRAYRMRHLVSRCLVLVTNRRLQAQWYATVTQMFRVGVEHAEQSASLLRSKLAQIMVRNTRTSLALSGF
jgi:hypothetical protein